MDTSSTGGQWVELNLSESWALLRQAVVGRIAVVVDDAPEIFPVNYLVDHGSIVFRTAEGTKLSGAVERSVAFEVDQFDIESGRAWSVVVKGRARQIKQLHHLIEAFELPLSTWHAAPNAHYIAIDAGSVTGRRFRAVGRD